MRFMSWPLRRPVRWEESVVVRVRINLKLLFYGFDLPLGTNSTSFCVQPFLPRPAARSEGEKRSPSHRLIYRLQPGSGSAGRD